MRKIINGLRYDTDKSTVVGRYTSGGSRRDFAHWQATLYRTPRSGRYFLCGEGGPMTRFGEVYSDGSRGYGHDLVPMSKEEALAWAEQYLQPELIEAGFAADIQDA